MKKCLVFILSVMMLALSAGASFAETSMMDEAVKRGTLRVGMSTFVPWAMQDKDGKLIGFEIDVATKFAEDHGLKVEFVPTKWAGIIPALLNKQFDLIIGSMSITPERNLKVNFSDPYDSMGMDLVASKKLAAGFKTLEDFNKEGVIIVARSGGSAKAAVEKHIPKATIKVFDEESQALQEVINGRAHAFASSSPQPTFEAARHPDTLFHPDIKPFTKEYVGMVVRKGDLDSLNVINGWIRKAEAEGFLQDRRDYWFGGISWADRVMPGQE